MNLSDNVLCDPYPNPKKVDALLMNMRSRLCNSFRYLSEQVMKKIDLSYPNIFEDINKFKNSDYPISILSSFHTHLVSMMEAGKALDVALLFKNFRESIFQRNAFSVLHDNITSSNYNAYAIDVLREVGKNTFDETYSREFLFEPPTKNSVSTFENNLDKTLHAIRHLDDKLFRELSSIVDFFFLANIQNMNAGVSFQTYGVIFIRQMRKDENWTRILEHLVHEAGHLHLYAIMTHDPIFDKSQPQENYSSPFRISKRPMGGIYHAMFVLTRTIYIFNLLKRDPLFQEDSKHIRTSYNEQGNSDDFILKFEETYKTIKENAHLTSIGSLILENCADLVHSH